MKKAFFTCILAALTVLTIQAQIATPAPSPSAMLKQSVGLTEITVEYSRPSMKGRDVFGGLVPYDEVWRLGANQATKITFSEDVKVGGKSLEAGAYAVLAKPGKSSWEFMFYPYTTGNWGAYPGSDVTPTTVSAEAFKMDQMEIETFMIEFDQITNSGANIWFLWENVATAVPVAVNTDETVEASIAQVMAGPTANDYFAAASYYLAEGKDMSKAREWITKAVDMGYNQFWVLRTKSLIEAKAGDKAAAIESAKKSLEMAKAANNNDYIRMNEASIKEWSM